MGWVTLDDGQHVFIGAGGKVYANRAAISSAGGAGERGRALASRSKAAMDHARAIMAHRSMRAEGRGTAERISKARELATARSNLHAVKAEVESSGVKAVIKSEKRMPHDPLFGLKNAVYDPNTEKVIINPGPARAGASRESLLSTARHEVGHALHQREGAGTFAGRFRYEMTAGRQWQNPRGPEIAGRVSKYARTNQREFVADTYRGMREGKQYDPEVMKLYHQLGGPGIAAQRSAMARELVEKRRASLFRRISS